MRPPLITDAYLWRRVVFDSFTSPSGMQVAIQPMEHPIRRFDLKIDSEIQTLDLTDSLDPEWGASLSYELSDPDFLELSGKFDGRIIRAKLRRVDTSNFLLFNRGFHWINERPFLH